MGADDLFGPSQDLVKRHDGGVEDDSVGGGLKRGFGAVAVAVVALFQFPDDGLFGETLLLGGERIGGLAVWVLTAWVLAVIGIAGCDRFGSGLTVAAVASDFGGSVEKDFHFGVGEDGGADVAAFHDNATGFTEGALLLNHPGAEAGMDGDFGGGGGDIGLANAAGDVDGVEQDAVAFELRLEGDAGAGGEGALAGAGGAVDGDDGVLAFFWRGGVRLLRGFGCLVWG